MKLRKHIPGIKLYRKFRYGKGYGIHSPFVYSLITKVIQEKAPFYAFDEIEKLREEILSKKNNLSALTKQETQSCQYGALLFRLVNFFKCKMVVQIGNSTGIMSLYLAMALPKSCDCFVITDRPEMLNPVKKFTLARNLNRLFFVEGNCEEELIKIQSISAKIDLLFINQLPKSTDPEQLLLLCRPFRQKGTIVIINGINRYKDMKELWLKLKNDSQSRVAIDLFALGILFFDDQLPKKQYKIYFDYGEKQNLYSNGRRRLYFPRGGKKGFKDRSAH